MASSESVRKLAISNIPPDPLGILKVSGFYGPGNWSGWFLTILTSIISIIRRPDSTQMHDLILHLLGTNWAAIDLISQISAYIRLDSSQDSNKERLLLHGSIAAAIIITAWGTVASIIQATLVLKLSTAPTNPTNDDDTADQKPITPRVIVLLIGTFIPSLALSYFLIFNTTTGTDYFGITKDLPAFYWKDSATNLHLGALHIAGGTGIITLVIIVISGGIANNRYFTRPNPNTTLPNTTSTPSPLPQVNPWTPVSLGTLIGLPIFLFFIKQAIYQIPFLFWSLPGILLFSVAVGSSHPDGMFLIMFTLYMTVICVMVPLVCVMIYISYIFTLLLSGFKTWKDTCLFMPCAPQKIGDWDQAFGLMVGLVMFGVEV